mmetsp:Transcript_24418/g.48624  ORF Transcript_24418/g.48624 Transcript_24418/m.48624 type:complete len:600 (-) Transcript_24418:529-2328(-)
MVSRPLLPSEPPPSARHVHPAAAARHRTIFHVGVRAATILSISTSLLSVRAGWVDPDTASKYRTTVPLARDDDRSYEIVFSDEFEKDGRFFGDGFDPRWTAIDKNDYTNGALHYYKAQNAGTSEGLLRIRTEQKVNHYRAFNETTKKFYSAKKNYQSAMLQGWNKFCITGGIVEISARLPGRSFSGGLWPALWLLGNLARGTYVGSSNFMWPYSYNKCDRSIQVSQEVSSCNRWNHYGLHPYQGRGAPEIDIIEVMAGTPEALPHTVITKPYASTSLQVAPGKKQERPVMGHRPLNGTWYKGMDYGSRMKTDLNPFFYGVTLEHDPKVYTYQSDAISANTQLDETHFDRQHVYRIEWEPADSDGVGGYVKWFIDGDFVYGIDGDNLALTDTMIPNEPMYLLLNTAMSKTWSFPLPCPPGCSCKCFECGDKKCECGLPPGFCDNFPNSFDIDYVRVYQAVNDTNQKVGCSTDTHPTKKFIEAHKKRYIDSLSEDKEPLKKIRVGGNRCDNDENCGGSRHGVCNIDKTCECLKGFTGPLCLAYDGFDDVTYDEIPLPFIVDPPLIPFSLRLMFVIMIISVLVATCNSVLQKQNRRFVYTSF